VGCRRRDPISALVRVVARLANGVNTLVVDQAQLLAGRGAWVHPLANCVDRAVSRQAFARALRLTGQVNSGALAGLRLAVGTAPRREETTKSVGRRVEGMMDTQ
jgi:predicted RNA-binding protein YlxR (DUF448 family)